MFQEKYTVLGVMSGTSLDGIDLALLGLELDGLKWRYTIHEATTVSYPQQWYDRLTTALNLDSKQLENLDIEYTEHLITVIDNFLNQVGRHKVDAVCSHGHTITHRPEEGHTLQIGNRPVLSSRLGVDVVCDFRVDDVALGGQGAPLVPIGDRLLFGDYDHCLNLGGFANVSFEKDGDRMAFDLCPINVVLNRLAARMGKPYDDKGSLAASGTVSDVLLAELDGLEFYHESGPKSLGMEWVNAECWPLIEKAELTTPDLLATATAHMGEVIGHALKEAKRVLITGGGAFNDHLIGQIGQWTSAELVLPNSRLVEYKEALVFGLLGVLKLRGEVNVLSSVTGADRDHSSGRIYKS